MNRAKELVALLDLTRIPYQFLSKRVPPVKMWFSHRFSPMKKRSGLIDMEQMWAIMDAMSSAEQNAAYTNKELRLEKSAVLPPEAE